mgnify:FL=1
MLFRSGVWSDYSRVPLASLKKSFRMGETFQQHERGEISDDDFIKNMCHELSLPLSAEQFIAGWQAVFVDLRPEVVAIMNNLREQSHRVVILSNTNQIHTPWWRTLWPEIDQAADSVYLSHEMGMRKPEAAIYQHVLAQEGFSPADTVFFDDNQDNLTGSRALGIKSVLVDGRQVIPDYFAQPLTASQVTA